MIDPRVNLDQFGKIGFQHRDNSYPVAAVGQKFQINADWPIASFNIQNPSGMWLYIPSIRQWVPPQTLGLLVNLDPPSRSIDFLFSAAPTGGVASTVTGGPITVTWYNVPINAYQGLDYGLRQDVSDLETVLNLTNANLVLLIDAINVLRQGYGANTAILFNIATFSANGSVNTLVPAAAGQRINIVSLVFTWVHNLRPRGTLVIAAQFLSGGYSTQVSLTAEEPTIPVPIPPGATSTNVNTAFTAGALPQDDTQSQQITATVGYYLT